MSQHGNFNSAIINIATLEDLQLKVDKGIAVDGVYMLYNGHVHAVSNGTISSVSVNKFPDIAAFEFSGGAAAYGEGPVWIGGRLYWSDGSEIKYTSPGFIQTIFNSALTITTQQFTHSISKYINKLKIINSGDNDIYVAIGDTAHDVYESLSDLDGPMAFPVSAGMSNIFECDINSQFFGIVAKTGSNSVRAIQGV